jgi:hypothetical protein
MGPSEKPAIAASAMQISMGAMHLCSYVALWIAPRTCVSEGSRPMHVFTGWRAEIHKICPSHCRVINRVFGSDAQQFLVPVMHSVRKRLIIQIVAEPARGLLSLLCG